MLAVETLAWIATGAALPTAALVALWLHDRRWRPEERRRRAAEEALRDSNPHPRVILDASGRVLAANAAARARWGDDTPLNELRRRVPRDDEDGRESLARLRVASEAPMREVLDVPLTPEAGGGAPEWLRVSVRPAQAPAGCVVWEAEDITARRAIDDVLRRERDDLSDFLYFLPVGTYCADMDGRIRFANQRFAEWLDWQPNDLAGRKVGDLVHEGPGPENEGTWRGVVVYRSRDGQPLSCFVAQDVFDDGGETLTRTAVLRLDDVTPKALAVPGDRRRPSSADAPFRRLFDRAPTALAVLDQSGTLEAVNGAFTQLVRLAQGDLTDRPLADLVDGEDRDSLEALLSRMALAGEAGAVATLDVRLAEATERVCSLAVAALAPDGETAGVRGFLVHAVDTTEQKNLEMQFAQAQKMQAMGQLAGGVAHDFNNLLTAMIGFCDLLLQRHGAGDPSFADIMQIKQNANRAANLVRQLLAFSRRQPLLPKLMNATDALSELSHLLRRLLGEQVTLTMVHGRELGLVRVDPGQFDQVIINLAVNARDAMPGGGALTIRTGVADVPTARRRGVEEVPPGRYVEIVVTDTGGGIPPEYLGRIFEPFFSTKIGVTGAGTGLGLSTVYGIVRQTEGFIFVESEPGEGATFTIWLPRHDPETGRSQVQGAVDRAPVPPPDPRPAAAPLPPPPVPEPEPAAEPVAEADLAGGGTILLVEDEDAVRVFATRALRAKGYTVMEARTGEGALDLLSEAPDIDLLITDMVMPGMDGATLARQVRTERPSIRVILISGYSEEVARGDLIDFTDIHFLPKPFDLARLAARVKEVLST